MQFRQKISLKSALEIFTPVSGHSRIVVLEHYGGVDGVMMHWKLSDREILKIGISFFVALCIYDALWLIRIGL